MTAGALSRRYRAVVEARSQPSGGIEMATFARRIGDDMAVRFGCGHDTFADRMASIAGARRAFEHAAHVAGFASRRGVSAGKRKAGGHVIEVAPARLRFGQRLQRHHGQRYHKQTAQHFFHSLHNSPWRSCST